MSLRKWFSDNELADIGWQRESGKTIVIEPEDIPDIEKGVRELKRCKAFLQCLQDREKGKVKHCYENDKRWRKGQAPENERRGASGSLGPVR